MDYNHLMNNPLNKIIQYSFYSLFILVPLILTPYNYELFEFNKMLTVYFFTIIITSAWLIKMILNKQVIFKKTPFTIPLLIFLTSQVISTILSIDIHTSIWGYYSRFHGGLLSTISYILLYFAYVSNMTIGSELQANADPDPIGTSSEPSTFIQNTLKVILSTGLIVSLYGIAEHFGIDKNLWVQDVQNRVFSTLGQPNWLAAYLITLIPISTHFSLKNQKYHFFTLTFYITLLFTKSRSGLVGFGLAWSIYWLLILLKNKIKSFPFKPFIIINSLLLLTTLIIGTSYTPNLRTVLKKGDTLTGNLAESQVGTAKPEGVTLADSPSDLGPPATSQGGSKSSDIRKVVWQGALNIYRHYPLFGSGVETFAYSYYNFRPTEHNLLSEWDFLYNKAHNEFLNFLATTGAFGLLSYLLIIICFIYYCLKNLKKSPLAPALLASYLGLVVSNFFGFAVVPVALFFFLFPAMVINHGRRTVLDRRPEKISSRDSEAGRTVLTGLVSLLTLYLLYSVIIIWKADRQFVLGKNYLQANQIQTAYAYLQKAITMRPNEPLFRSLYSESAAKMALLYHQNITPEQATKAATLRDQLVEESIKNSDLVITQNKVHLNFYKSRAKVFFLLSQIDEKYHQNALTTLQQSINLAPTDPKLRYNLGLLYSQLGQTGLAEQTLKETIDLKPNYEAARFALGSLYQQTDRPDLAREQYQYILKHLNPQNLTVKEKLEKI